MKLTDRKIRKKMSCLQNRSCDTEHMMQVLQSAKEAFCESETEDILTGLEFLYQQAGYIQKRWWVIQGVLLVGLGLLLKYRAVGNYYTQRIMGIAAPLFVILLVPEMWKNRTAGAIEVEGAAYFSLRQIYSARMLLFGVIDVLMLSAFSLAAVRSGNAAPEEIMLQFFLPLVVTCCVCFRTLYSKRAVSEASSIFLCILWSALWLRVILLGNIYEAVAVPVWYAVLAVSFFYFLYCIYRGQRDWRRIWEVKDIL